MAQLLKVDVAYAQEVQPTNSNSSFTLEELQSFVGGDIQYLTDIEGYPGQAMVINADGHYTKCHQLNALATAITYQWLTYPILGDALLGTLDEVALTQNKEEVEE